ncbi:MAG TPA: pyruvate kinase, partial [Gammaproteobacteria bacterium]|nr:pyruvate kinase [Gammaproteobacteria bacterium]
NSQTRRRLALNRAVTAYRIAFSNEPEKTLQRALEMLRDKMGFDRSEKVVVISDVLADEPTEAIQVRALSR